MRGFFVSLSYLLLYGAIAFVLVGYVLPFVFPFVLAVLLAVAMEPAVRWLVQNARISRALACGLVLALACGIMLTVLGIGLSRLFTELFNLSGSLPQYYKQASGMVEDLAKTIGEFASALPTPLQTTMSQQLGRVYTALEKLLGAVFEGVKGLPSLFGLFVVTVIATYFVSRDKDMLLGLLQRVFPGISTGKVTQARTEVLESTVGLLKAQMILVLVTMAIVTVALSLMGSEYALVLGIITGLLDVLPIVGPGIVFVPWALYSLVFGSPVFGVMLFGLYGVMSATRQVLETKIIGERTGLHPLLTLLSMYLGIRFFGAAGIIIGPLSAIVLKAVVRAGLIPGWPGASRTV
ncbi:MAG: sporulation integral membrane protein YtvI [Bacillota bacterium]|nr:sporulation integral membrane protein YtvI [Bacillota bacterium]